MSAFSMRAHRQQHQQTSRECSFPNVETGEGEREVERGKENIRDRTYDLAE